MNITAPLYQYILENSIRDQTGILAKLREETAKMPMSEMQISPDQGQFMAFLVELIGAKQILELGTFTGYSALWMAQALLPGGKLITCDRSIEWTVIAKKYWGLAGVDSMIELRLGEALESLHKLTSEGQRFDCAFIDADKVNYIHYYEAVLHLLNPGGLMMIDNVLQGGRVVDEKSKSDSVKVIRELNTKIHHDTRVSVSMLSIRDGLTLVRKR